MKVKEVQLHAWSRNVGKSQLFFSVLCPLVRNTAFVIPQHGSLVNPVITRQRPQSYWT